MKKKRVETFRYGDGRIYHYHYTDSAAAVGPPEGLAQARPNNNLLTRLNCIYSAHNVYSWRSDGKRIAHAE